MLDRYAGDRLMQSGIAQDRPVVPGFNTEDLQDTPEITAPNRPVLMPGKAFPMDLLKDKYILNSPGSGVAQLVPNMVERAIDNYTSDPDDAVMDDIAYPMRVRPIEFDMNLIRKKNPRSFMPQV